MKIQLRHGRESEAGDGDFWILTCDLFEKTKPNEDVPAVHLCIKHQCGEGAFERVLLQFDEHSGETRIIVTEDEYADLVDEYVREEEVSRVHAEENLAIDYATDEYCKVVWGWNPLKKAEEMRKRWEAIKLLVDPHITI